MVSYDAEEMFWKNIVSISDARGKIEWGKHSEEEFNTNTPRDIEFIKKHLDITKDDVVLDYGAGIGRLMKPLASECKYMIGLDVSNAMVAFSKEYLKDIENANITQCSTIGENHIGTPVDKIYSFIAMQHMDKYKVYATLVNLKKILSPGGKGLFQFPDLLKSKEAYHNYATIFMNNRDSTCSLHFWTKEEAKFIFELAGWKITDIIDWEATGTDFWVLTE